MSDVAIQLDELNHDVLYARRVEMFFEPNPDGSESLNGKVVWHTEWWHYSGELLRGKSLGPRIERSVESILAEEYTVGEGGAARHRYHRRDQGGLHQARPGTPRAQRGAVGESRPRIAPRTDSAPPPPAASYACQQRSLPL